MKKVLTRIPIVILLLLLLSGITLGSGCGPRVLTITFTTPPRVLDADSTSGIITIEIQDANGTPYVLEDDTVISLTTTSSTGRFFTSPTANWYVTAVTILTGSSSASFYYKDTTAGSPIITVTESPSQGWTAATQEEDVNAAALDHFKFAGINNQTENSTFSISITAEDAYGNTVTSYTGTNTLSDTTYTIKPTTTGAFVGGVWTGEVTIASMASGVVIATSGADKTGVSSNFDIVSGVAGAGTKLVFTTATQTVDAGNVSGIITVQVQDSDGNPYNMIEDTLINLTSSSAGGIFYSDAEGLNQISQATIKAGESQASFYYKDTTAGLVTITGAESPSQGWTAAVQEEVVNAGALDHFTFGVISNQIENSAFSISITAQDIYDNTVTSYTGTNTLSDTTGTVNPTTTGSFVNGVWTGQVTITSVGSGATITTSGADKAGVSNAFNIAAGAGTTAGKLVFTTPLQTVDASNVSGMITIQAQDSTGTPYNVAADTVINLTSSSTGGTFYSDAEGLNQISQITINIGNSSTSFYYKDPVAGSPTIMGAETPSQDWTDATQVLIVNAGALDHFTFTGISNQTENSAFSVSIAAQDVYGNTVTSYTGTNTLSDTTGTISPTTTGAFVDGVWTGEVTIASVRSGVIITTSGADKTGVSDVFDIIVGAVTAGGKLVFTNATQTIDANNVSGIITVQAQDSNGNPYNVTEDMVVNLTSSSAGGTFYSDAEGSNQTSQVTIKAGGSQVSFYYKDTTAGSATITGAVVQGWTSATGRITIRAASTGTLTGTELPLYIIIIIGVGGLILGVGIGYFVFFRTKFAAKRKGETRPKPVPAAVKTESKETDTAIKEPETIATQEQAEAVDTTVKEPVPEVTEERAEVVGITTKEPVPEVTEEKAEAVETTIKEPVPEVTPEEVEVFDTTEKIQVSELLQEIEANHQIATTTSGNLTAFQTQVWDFKHEAVNALPAGIKEELTKAYADIYQANGIVWLANQLGRRSPNLDDNYTKLCKGIAEQLDKVQKQMG